REGAGGRGSGREGRRDARGAVVQPRDRARAAVDDRAGAAGVAGLPEDRRPFRVGGRSARPPQTTIVSVMTSGRVMAGLVVAAACAALTIAPWAHPPGVRASSPELAHLVAALGAHRMVEPRLTGGFSYGRLQSPVRSVRPPLDDFSPDVRIAI